MTPRELEIYLTMPEFLWTAMTVQGKVVQAIQQEQEFNFTLELALTDLKLKIAQYLSLHREVWGENHDTI